MSNNLGVDVKISLTDNLTENLKKTEEAMNNFRKTTEKNNKVGREEEIQNQKINTTLEDKKKKIKELTREEEKELFVKRKQRQNMLKEFEQDYNKINNIKKVNRVQQGINNVGMELFTTIASAFAAKKVFDTISEWDKVSRKIQGITHATDNDMELLQQKIVSVSNKTGKSAIELQHEVFNLTRTWNHGTQKITDNLDSIANAAITTTSSISTIADVYLPLQQQFNNLTPQDTFNLITFAGDKASQTMEEFRYGITEATMASKNFNQNVYTMMATMSTLGRLGIKGSEAGIGIRNMFTQLANPNFRKNFQELGIDFNKINLKNVDFIKALEIIQKRFDILKGKKGGELVIQEQLIKIFGRTYASSFNTLLQNINELKKQDIEARRFVTENAGQKILEQQMKGIYTTFQRLKTQVEIFALKFSVFAPYLEKSFSFVLDTFDKVGKSWDDIYKTSSSLGQSLMKMLSTGGLAAIIGGIVGAGIGTVVGVGPVAGARIGAGISGVVGGIIGLNEESNKSLTGKVSSFKSNDLSAFQKENNIALRSNIPINYQKLLNNTQFGNLDFDKKLSNNNSPIINEKSNQINSNTNIILEIQDKVGVKFNIKDVTKDNNGNVKIDYNERLQNY